MPRTLLSPAEVGEHLGVTAETIRRLHRAKRIPGYRAGRHLRFDLDEVRDALRVPAMMSPSPSATRATPDFDALQDAPDAT